jgi:hypothetical protein
MALSHIAYSLSDTPRADLIYAQLLDFRQMGVILCGVDYDIACDVTAKLAFLQVGQL